MNSPYLFSPTPLIPSADWRAMLDRLIGNLSGFVYRRRHDVRWTMEFVSAGCRDITGFDPHRFIGNGSIAFADLIARSDWKRVSEHMRLAALHRRRAQVNYHIRVAHGAWVQVEDRLTPIVDPAGNVRAFEGVIDHPRLRLSDALSPQAPVDEARIAAADDSHHQTSAS